MSVGGGVILADLVFQAPRFGLVGSLLVALCIAATLLAYTTGLRWRQQGKPTRLVLLALRMGAIICLFLTLLHPAWVRQRSAEKKPIVAVVLDDSLSMAQPAIVDGLVRGSTQDMPTRTAVGMAPVESVESRYQRASSTLTDRLLPALKPTHRLRLFDVAARALRPDNLPDKPAAQSSPLTDTLLHVQRTLRDQPVVGIVLLSDGAETADQPVVGGMEQIRVPVYAIDDLRLTIDDFGSAGAGGGLQASSAMRPDLSIQSVSANRRALAGNTVQVLVDVATTGDPGDEPVPIALLHGGKTVVSRVVRLQAGESGGLSASAPRVERCQLEFIPHQPGEFTYTVAVGPLPGEIDRSNNRDTFPLSVRAKPLTVRYVDGVLRWEGKFVREALGRDPDINVISAVRTARAGTDSGSQGLLRLEQLANVDVVILGDVEARYFSSHEELDAVCTWVTDNGGGLVLTGGYRSFGPEGFGRTALHEILPIEFSAAANPQIEQPFNLRLTDPGSEHPVFHMTGDRVRDTAFFHRLPPLHGCSRVVAVKPGAEVLAVNPQVRGRDGSQGLPVMAVQQVGAGRTMVFAVDTTWRWRMVVGGFTGDSSFFERFWGQIVRWMAGRDEDSPRQLFLATDQTRYRLGETITLNIELRVPVGDEQTMSHAWQVNAHALDEGGRQMKVPLAELGEGKYRGTLAAREPGRLDLAVTAQPSYGVDEDGTQRGGQSQVVTVEVDRPDKETLDPRPNPLWLARVAQLSGGRCINPEQIETWAARLPAERIPTTEARSSGAWGDRFFGSAFVLLLCAEWILRRRSQLA